mmetsp:Transcript_78988/g.218628  ORF Transcript_78988/g.218628 Transcript_78988/m.218628 type:complete len:266 (-) Transcript_78988:797-1594(-)
MSTALAEALSSENSPSDSSSLSCSSLTPFGRALAASAEPPEGSRSGSSLPVRSTRCHCGSWQRPLPSSSSSTNSSTTPLGNASCILSPVEELRGGDAAQLAGGAAGAGASEGLQRSAASKPTRLPRKAAPRPIRNGVGMSLATDPSGVSKPSEQQGLAAAAAAPSGLRGPPLSPAEGSDSPLAPRLSTPRQLWAEGVLGAYSKSSTRAMPVASPTLVLAGPPMREVLDGDEGSALAGAATVPACRATLSSATSLVRCSSNATTVA